MKQDAVNAACTTTVSLPTRGAWIETAGIDRGDNERAGRSPRGERGLKQQFGIEGHKTISSLPTRGAWIETDKRSQHLLRI